MSRDDVLGRELRAAFHLHAGRYESVVVGEWAVETGVTCVVCPDCAFTFDACHTNDTPEGGYSCPLCEVNP